MSEAEELPSDSATDAPDADEYTVTLDDGTEANVTEFADAYKVSSDRKLQLDRYEPITEFAMLGGEFPEDDELTPESKLAIIMETARLARDICEVQVMRRYEEYVREEAFGDD